MQCLDVRLGKQAIEKTRFNADTNKLEACHRAYNVSNPKDVTYRRNAKGRKFSAAARLNDGRANSALEKAAAHGAPHKQNTKVVHTLKQFQDKNDYDKSRQNTPKYKTKRYQLKLEKFKAYDEKRQNMRSYSTDVLDK